MSSATLETFPLNITFRMGETGRQPDAPDYAKTPLELLTARKGEGFSLFDKYGITTISTLGGVVGVYFFNRTKMRPFWAGMKIYIHVVIVFPVNCLNRFCFRVLQLLCIWIVGILGRNTNNQDDTGSSC